MGTTFFLVRHALKEKAIGDVAITPEGEQQAMATARSFAEEVPIEIILSSPLRRAKETATVIASLQSKQTISVDSRLRERANWGDLPGQTFEQFVAMWERCTREPDFIPPVGDSAKRAGMRLAALLDELAEKHPDGSRIVLVTHGGLITDYLVHAFEETELKKWHPDFVEVQSSLIPECSVTKLIYEDGIFTLDVFASVEHLQY